MTVVLRPRMQGVVAIAAIGVPNVPNVRRTTRQRNTGSISSLLLAHVKGLGVQNREVGDHQARMTSHDRQERQLSDQITAIVAISPEQTIPVIIATIATIGTSMGLGELALPPEIVPLHRPTTGTLMGLGERALAREIAPLHLQAGGTSGFPMMMILRAKT